ncbi:MAG: PhzF family phenazine biosynthesis protein [Chloroflexota bacterium]
MSRAYPFRQVDAFTSRPFYGNPVAVIFDADDLSDDQMQMIARWTNLSETTFFQQPSPNSGADYRLRIFTPANELPFAGHPTIGSAHAYIERGGARLDPSVMRMECGAGVLALRTMGEGSEAVIFAETPEARFDHEFGTSVEAIEKALNSPISKKTPPAAFTNGPTWLFTPMESSAALAALKPDMTAVARLSADFSLTGIAAFAITGGDPAIHIRCFAPGVGVPEDPVTGSANGALPSYLERFGLIDRTGREYVSMQGMEIGRDGRVHIRVGGDGRTEIGGQSVTVVEGELRV